MMYYIPHDELFDEEGEIGTPSVVKDSQQETKTTGADVATVKLNKPKITKQGVDRLIRIVSLQAASHDGDAQDKIVREFLKIYKEQKGEKALRKLEIKKDDYGNYYITKGKGIKRPPTLEGKKRENVYPTYAAHLDQVKSAIGEGYEVYRQGDILFAFGYQATGFNKGWGQIGTGGDDLCGVWLCLEMLLSESSAKVVLYQNEEVGCLGSKHSIKNQKDWYSNCSFILQGDRNQACNDFISRGSGTALQSKKFKEKVSKILPEYDYKDCTTGGRTDVVALVDGDLGLSVANIACGYHAPHSRGEIIFISQVFNCLDLMKRIHREMGSMRWPLKKAVKVIPRIPRNHTHSRSQISQRHGDQGTFNLMLKNSAQKGFRKSVINLGVGKSTTITKRYFITTALSMSVNRNYESYDDLPDMIDSKGEYFKFIRYKTKDDLYFKVEEIPQLGHLEDKYKFTRIKTSEMRDILSQNVQDFISFSGDHYESIKDFNSSGDRDPFKLFGLYDQKPKGESVLTENIFNMLLHNQGFKHVTGLPLFVGSTRLMTSNKKGVLFRVTTKLVKGEEVLKVPSYTLCKVDLNYLSGPAIEGVQHLLVTKSPEPDSITLLGMPVDEDLTDCPSCGKEEFEELAANFGSLCDSCGFFCTGLEREHLESFIGSPHLYNLEVKKLERRNNSMNY